MTPARRLTKDRAKGRLARLEQFWARTDWAWWYDQFETTLTKEIWYTGKGKTREEHSRNTSKPKWSVDSFARHKAKNLEEYDFIKWLIGTPEAATPRQTKEFKFAGKPQNWEWRRQTGGWATDEFLANYTKQIRTQQNALDKCRDVGDTYILKIMAANDRILHELDVAFRGRPCLRNMSDEDNMARAKNYIGLRKSVQDLQQHSLEMYWMSLGVNMKDIQAGNIVIQNYLEIQNHRNEENRPKTEFELLTAEANKMTIRKMKENGIRGPEFLQKLIRGREPIDVVPEKVEDEDATTNGKVQ